MRRFISLKLRTCTRCGHLECPCCRDFCDNIRCIESDDKCGDELQCVFAEPPDAVGYAALDVAVRNDSMNNISTVNDGVLCFTEDDVPTDDELEALRKEG